MKKYRDKGAIGALLDEYEKAIKELKVIFNGISDNDLIEIVDFKAEDDDCRSIQTVLTHVIQAGYTYVIEIRKWLGEEAQYINKEFFYSIKEYNLALDKMFAYNEKLFEDHPSVKLEENEISKQMFVKWGQYYDVEQLLEHAIVHILRHRRQIERFKIKLKNRKSS